ncbi:MAG TPA: hypothetical protein VGW36_07400 [Pyrinomonadaceae bacterium]|nr:hypothetical protein [Pyrinomonadaceae bacterium]
MKTLLLAIPVCALTFTVSLVPGKHGGLSAVQAQQSTAVAPVDTDRIVSAATAKETEFRNALGEYTFKRDVVVQTLGAGGQITGEYRRVSRLSFDESGKRVEKILQFPPPSLQAIGVSTEDLDNLGGVQLFALEASQAPLYNFKYVGKERIDEVELHMFDVSPKSLPDPKKVKDRLFQGRIWVDTEGHQIMKIRGKGMPEPKNIPFPTVETYRELIDERHWFPTYSYADEELLLGGGGVVKIRMRVKFSEFERVNRK